MTSQRLSAAQIADVARARPARLAECRLICIDGPAGSGKTTLGDALCAVLSGRGAEVALLHMDDFYEGWSGLHVDLEPRLLSQVFEPLSRANNTQWQQYDWHQGRFDAWHELAPTDYLVVEGCGSGALAYADYRTLLVFVEASRETRLRRGIKRDGPAVEPEWLAWMDREQAHFEVNNTRENADVQISTDDL